MRRFRSRRFAMLLILMLTLSMGLQGAATVSFAELNPVSAPESAEPVVETPQAEPAPAVEEPTVETPPAEPAPAVEEPAVETPPSEPVPAVEEPAPEIPPAETDAVVEEPLPDAPPVTEEPEILSAIMDVEIQRYVPSAGITITKLVDRPAVPAGEEVSYSFIITNVGEVDLVNVKIEDPAIDYSKGGMTLAAGESKEIEGIEYTIVRPNHPGSNFLNTASVEGWYEADGRHRTDALDMEAQGRHRDWKKVSDSDFITVNLCPSDPGIQIVKSVEPESAFPGDTVTYTFVVTNTGNRTLNNVQVMDEAIGYSSDAVNDFKPGDEPLVFEADWTIPCELPPCEHVSIQSTEGDIFHNVATVSATTGQEEQEATVAGKHHPRPPHPDPGPEDEDVTAESNMVALLVKYAIPDVELHKTVYASDNEPASLNAMVEQEECLIVGLDQEVVYYRFHVVNTGNATLYDVEVNDPMLGEPFPVGTLEAGAEWESDMIPYPLDGVTFPLENTANVTGHDFCGETVYDDDTACVDLNGITPEADIDVEKTANASAVRTGTEVSYTITVTNTGSMNLYNVLVADEKLGWSETISEMVPGAVSTFTVSHIVMSGDWDDSSQFINTATATGSTCGQENDAVSDGECQIVTDSDNAVVTRRTSRGGGGGGGGGGGNTTTTIESEPVPEALPEAMPDPIIAETVPMTEEIIPLAVPVLPQTGELPATLFYGLGGMLTALGAFLKRK